MERLKLADVRSLSEFLRGLYSARDLDGFVGYTLENLPSCIPSDLTVYGELNPHRRQFRFVEVPHAFTAAYKEVFQRYSHEHPFARNYLGGGDGSATTMTDILPRRQLHRLGLYNEFFRPLQMHSEMVIWLPARRPREITFAVHRSRMDFSERDRLFLNLLRPHLAQAYSNAEALMLLSNAGDMSGHGFLLISPTARVEHMNHRALALAREYFDVAVHLGRPLPDSLSRWLKHQERLLTERDDVPRPPRPLVIEQDRKQLSVRVLFGPAHRMLLLEEHLASPEPSSLAPLGLTPREAEVLTWVAQGKTNDAIARILGLSFRTVEKHVENTLEKLGVESRTAAAARALEFLRAPVLQQSNS